MSEHPKHDVTEASVDPATVSEPLNIASVAAAESNTVLTLLSDDQPAESCCGGSCCASTS